MFKTTSSALTRWRQERRDTRLARAVRLWASIALAVSAVVSMGQGAAPAGPPTAVPAARQAENVAVITIRDEINRVTAMSVRRRIHEAADAGADALVFEIDSPGGEVGAVLEIANEIKSSPVPNTVAWVNPNAYSGGAIIALACRELVASDPASMGDAFPITMDARGVRGLREDERKKFLPPLLAEVADSARRHGYDEYIVQAIVIDGIELWAVRDDQGRVVAIDADEYRLLFAEDPPRGRPMLTGVTRTGSGRGITRSPVEHESAQRPAPAPADGPADARRFRPASDAVADLEESISEALEIDSDRPTFTPADRGQWTYIGYITDGSAPIVLRTDQLEEFGFLAATVQNDEELRAFFGARNLGRLDQSWSEHMVAFLTNWMVRGVLIVIFLLALFIELASPGLVFPGAIAVAALFALLAPPALVGMAGWWELAAIVIGIGFILIEVFVVPGVGVFGVLGLLAIFGGLLGTFIPRGSGLFPDTPQGQRDLLFGLVAIAMALITTGVGVYFISKHLKTIPILGRLVLTDTPRDDDPGDSDLAAIRAEPDAPVQVGDTGVTITTLRPAGRADFGDRTLDVVAEGGYIDADQPVVVTSVTRFRIGVEPDPDAPVRAAGGESTGTTDQPDGGSTHG